MATGKELFDAGKLQASLDAVTAEVKANPTDVKRRTFLFELLCLAGEWDRAEKQIDVIGQQSIESAMAVTVYRANIKAERERIRLFQDGAAPHFLSEPPAYVDLYVEAIGKLRKGEVAAARELLDRAEEQRPALTGTFNGETFLDFRDYNDLTAGALELIVKDKYAWLAFEHIQSIEIDPPKSLRDLLWVPARIKAADGTTGEVFIPARYFGSSEHSDDRVRLGRMTDWKAVSEDLFQGMGLRVFLIGEEEQSVLETRRVAFGAAAAQAADAAN
ncbi:MAG TPA: type VI secretion system accessory protein TagJ [Thermoanaerobaculia bacterium]|nr:type VI secretion system accessory protein TagJ [Thermoanaerobaculia bacterium]